MEIRVSIAFVLFWQLVFVGFCVAGDCDQMFRDSRDKKIWVDWAYAESWMNGQDSVPSSSKQMRRSGFVPTLKDRKSIESFLHSKIDEYRKSGDDIESRDPELRKKLMAAFLPGAHHWGLSTRYAVGYIHELPVDDVDLSAQAYVGLEDAFAHFDSSKGVKFTTYAPKRVRGAVIDHLRSLDLLPRLVRSRGSQRNRIENEHQAITGRLLNSQEYQDSIPMEPGSRKMDGLMRDSVPRTQVSLNDPSFQSDSGAVVERGDLIEAPFSEDPSRIVIRRLQMYELLRGLSREERVIMILYYIEEMTMKEIGRVVELSESRVSQIHSSILLRLKAKFSSKDLESH